MSLRGRLTREGDEKLLNPPVCQPVETKAAIGVAPKPKEQEAQLVVSCLMGPCFNDVITFPYAADHVPQRGRLHTQWTCLLSYYHSVSYEPGAQACLATVLPTFAAEICSISTVRVIAAMTACPSLITSCAASASFMLSART